MNFSAKTFDNVSHAGGRTWVRAGEGSCGEEFSARPRELGVLVPRLLGTFRGVA